MITIDMLRRLWPNGNSKVPGLIEGIAAAAPTVFPKYGLDSDLVVAHAMAQFSHECGAGLEMVENLSYSAERLPEVWPKHFNSSNAGNYAHNPQKLANFIYEPPVHNDLGNRPDSDDGWNFRGRGLSQVTGRDGYQKLADKTGLNLMTNPSLLSDPQFALECGVADFVLCGCLPPAQQDDVVGVTRRLNGGTVGLAEREAWLSKWKAALASSPSVARPASVPTSAPVPVPVPAPLPPVVVQPKHKTGIAVAVAGIVAALQQHSIEIAVGIGVAVVVIVLLLHFFWPKKGP